MLKSNKYINNIVLSLFTIMLIISCENISPNYLGVAPHIVIRPDILEPSTDIIVECTNVNMFDWTHDKETLIDCYGGDGERDADKLLKRFYNSRVFFRLNSFDVKREKIFYNFGGNYDISYEYGGSIFKEKVSGYKAVYTLKNNVTSTLEAKFYGHHGGYKDMNLYIKYPEILRLKDNNVKTGDEVELTSEKPFFDEATFSVKKLTDLLNLNYYIVWMSKSTEIKTDSTTTNWNFEKEPVPREYYIFDKTTPYSITFKIPPFAKSGKVHIINETGFEISGDKSKSIIVSKPNSYAYYSTKEELVILDESGNEVR